MNYFYIIENDFTRIIDLGDMNDVNKLVLEYSQNNKFLMFVKENAIRINDMFEVYFKDESFFKDFLEDLDASFSKEIFNKIGSKTFIEVYNENMDNLCTM